MAHGYRQNINMADWMGSTEKRLRHESRRPTITSASDLLGPGIAPRAIEVLDWNDDVTLFNGFFFSGPGAIHGPDPTKWWMGESLSDDEQCGFQRVTNYRGVGGAAADPTLVKVRTFMGINTGTRVWTSWVNG